jgi:ATPase subunit of ABC transporter with duplicated ATPase domains
MSVLTVDNLGHGFGDRNLFKEVSFRLLNGERVGLVGANGVGKSTLMNLLTGQLVADEGRIEWTSRVKVGYLDQHTKLIPGKTMRDVLNDAFLPLFEREKEMLEITEKMAEASPEALERLLEEMGQIQEELDTGGFYLIDSQVESIAQGLGLTAVGLDRQVQDLSGGQRTKVLLAKLLLEKPTVLLLDEPTNYLDVEHIQWLVQYLKDYPYSFILISHDTSFMNEVVNAIYHLEFTNLTRYTGNYEKFLEASQLKKEQYFDQYERQQEQIAKMEDFIQRNKARASTTGRAKSRQKQLNRMEKMDRPETAVKPTFAFAESRASGKWVVTSEELVVGYNRPLLPPLKLELERGKKVAIVGCNGIGKSSLLKTIMGIIAAYKGKIELGDYLYPAYFEQEAKSSQNTALDEVWNEYPHMTQQEVRGALARSGLKNEHILRKMGSLSGGEQAKVRLCKLMLTPSNWIVFDEPTNHLDVVAKEELKKALMGFKGTVMIVCHETEFYEGWVTDVWNVEEWAAETANR